MEQVKKFYEPGNNLTLIIRVGDAYDKAYIEVEVSDGNFPKMPRQFYVLRVCPPEEQEQCYKLIMDAFKKQYPNLIWEESPSV